MGDPRKRTRNPAARHIGSTGRWIGADGRPQKARPCVAPHPSHPSHVAIVAWCRGPKPKTAHNDTGTKMNTASRPTAPGGDSPTATPTESGNGDPLSYRPAGTTGHTSHDPSAGNGGAVGRPRGRVGRLAARLMYPLKFLVQGRRNSEGSLRHALQEIIEESQRSEDAEPIAENERKLLLNILKLRDLTAEDVMVPRADIVAAPSDIDLNDLISLMSKEAHSRIPIYRESLDDVIGFVHMKDVISSLTGRRAFNLKRVMRTVLIVAPSMRVHDLLLHMRLTRVHMAMVVDEFGGIDGLVTIEDLIETIVGEIEDEHETDDAMMRMTNEHEIIASGRATVEELEDLVGPILTEEEREDDIDTLGGLVAYVVGRVPSRGEIVLHDSGLSFEVLEADPRRIKRLRITNVQEILTKRGTDTSGSDASAPTASGAATPAPTNETIPGRSGSATQEAEPTQSGAEPVGEIPLGENGNGDPVPESGDGAGRNRQSASHGAGRGTEQTAGRARGRTSQARLAAGKEPRVTATEAKGPTSKPRATRVAPPAASDVKPRAVRSKPSAKASPVDSASATTHEGENVEGAVPTVVSLRAS